MCIRDRAGSGSQAADTEVPRLSGQEDCGVGRTLVWAGVGEPHYLPPCRNFGGFGERKGKGNLNKEEESNSETEAHINAPSSFRLRAEALGHPLMNRDRCVRNDIDMVKRPFFIIVTGANMAGKMCIRDSY